MIRECGCPSETPEWHNQDIDLAGQCIHTMPTSCFLHMPIAYELYAKRQQTEIENLELEEKWPGLSLTRSGMFRGKRIRLLMHSRSASRRISYLPSPFNLRVQIHKGNMSTVQVAVREMSIGLIESGKRPKELYICHLNCPSCMKTAGNDRIMLLRHWIDAPGLKRK
ncbi:MAG: hypothetical protein COB33_012925 [Thiotrichaceae bacterium]|nr:hypothetical protein [Thiotrichaceae bacterium]PCI14794.1 MAG: hypothetical protein COB71_01675 [Thiotrichales bacterium]